MKIICKSYGFGVKCGRCDNEVSELFCFEGRNPDEVGMCGQCFTEFLMEMGYEVVDKEELEAFIKKLLEKFPRPLLTPGI